jgi:hypothetical protein
MAVPLEDSLVKHIWTDKTTTSTRPATGRIQRAAERRAITLPARLTWKDQRGTTRFAAVVTRDVSDQGVYVECVSNVSIPLYRLVQFQLDPQVRVADGLPVGLKNGRVLAAVYRVSPPQPSGARQGLALRLMVDPCRRAAADAGEEVRATA